MKKEISGKGLLSVWLLISTVALGVGAVMIGGSHGRTMGLIAFMSAISFTATLIPRRDDG
jgi:hypothetical protein